MAVAVDGPGPERVAGGLLSRLLRRALVLTGLAVLAWLFGMLLATTASASPTPPPPPGQGEPAATFEAFGTTATESAPTSQPGLLGLVGGLTSTIDSVTNTLTTTVDGLTDTLTTLANTVDDVVSTATTATTAVNGLTGSVLDTTTSVVVPVLTPLPAAPVVTPPAPEPVDSAKPNPAGPSPAQPVVAPAEPVQPAPIAESAAVLVATHNQRRTHEVLPQRPIANDAASTSTDQANRPAPNPLPGKVPSVPQSPAVPTSTVTSAHDGSGQARGTHGVLAGQADLDLSAEARTIRDRPAGSAGRMAGLPATSPD